MKLSKPGDIEETEEPGEQPSGDRGDVIEPGDVMIQTSEGEMPLPEVVEQNAEMLDQADDPELAAHGEVQNVAEELVEMRQMVEQQRGLIAELLEAVEVLSMAVANDYSIEHAHEVWADYGIDRTAMEWEGDAYELKQERYE